MSKLKPLLLTTAPRANTMGNGLIIFLCLFLLAPKPNFAQRSLSTKSKKAAELYYQADNYRVRGQYLKAEILLQQAIEKDKKFHEAYFRLAVIKKAKGKPEEAEKLFHQVVALNEGNNGPSYFELGELYLKQNKYKLAEEYINKYLAYNPQNKRRVEEANVILSSARYALKNQQANLALQPRLLSEKVNAFPMQYFPVITVDGKTLIYTRRLGTTSQFDEDLVMSIKDETGAWGTPKSISENINSEFNEGTCTISADGRTLIFVSCSGRSGFGSCDLYISVKQGNEWSTPKNMGEKVNSSSWDSQPSLSADGRTLYFISNRGGGIGRRDIWVTTKTEQGTWQRPKNMGSEINSPGDEVSPFIHPNNRELYFSTNSRPGFGGFDIYYSTFEQQWSAPINLGAPINNGQDQVSLFIDAQGNKGYYSNEDNKSSKRKGVLYEFDLPEAQKIKYNTSWVSGQVTDAVTRQPLSASIELFNLENNERAAMVSSDPVTGNYLMVLTEGAEYGLYISKSGYLYKSYTFRFEMSQHLQPVEMDISLDPIKVNATTTLSNLFFETNEYKLKSKSKTELRKVIDFIKSNPTIKVEISGHTDNVGANAYNKTLSTKRASSVYDFLIKNGVDKNHLTTIGKGSAQPVADNATEVGRQANRRIEFKILSF